MAGKCASVRRFARVCNRFRSGVVGRDFGKFRRCVLTTRVGDDNGYSKLRKDLGKLVKQLRYKGVMVEYIFCPHITGAGMLHLDGFMYLKKGDVELMEIQILWSNIHGAQQVVFKKPASFVDVMKYATGHMEKDWEKLLASGFRGRVLISQGWLPKGALRVQKWLVRMALNSLYELGEGVWDLKDNLYERWLNYEVIKVMDEEGIEGKIQREKE